MELREDAFTGSLVVVAPQRHGIGAPQKPLPAALPEVPLAACPFCPGHEAETEATIERIPASGAWSARVVGNRFPLVGEGTGLPGRHEVIVEHPGHDEDWATFDDAHAAALLSLYRRRVRAVEAVPGVAYASLFRNRGRRAGSSQPHPHAQLVGLSVTPPDVARRDERMRAHHARTGETLLATLLRETLEDGRRVVHEGEHAVVLCPHAPHRVHELWVVPRVARGALAHDDGLDPALGPLLARATRALAAVTGDADRNLIARTVPVPSARAPHASFHFELCPRTTGGAGFELGTGIDVITVPPEASAAAIRALW
jgi:UDPglucose--hexose-1-phosphate uridylyltransferase